MAAATASVQQQTKPIPPHHYSHSSQHQQQLRDRCRQWRQREEGGEDDVGRDGTEEELNPEAGTNEVGCCETECKRDSDISSPAAQRRQRANVVECNTEVAAVAAASSMMATSSLALAAATVAQQRE